MEEKPSSVPLVCIRRADLKVCVGGSSDVICSACGAAVVVAPSSKKALGTGVLRPICFQCWAGQVEGNVSIAMLPGAAEEIRRWKRDEVMRN